MENIHKYDKFQELHFSEEIKKSFLDYAMSVIVSRALPDLRDGLKPVQRRIIYGMNELGAVASSPYKKSARITGDVMGKYHPHGDSSIYSAIVRMAQDFSYREPLVDGHGNFGSIDGDGAAAARYTEAKMSKISMELIRDINKDTVDFVPNYDGEEKEPVLLPARFPNILVNGSTGIAVGMATNIPPHNLKEVIEGCIKLIDNPDITTEELMQTIKGPDFPTGAIILGNSGIREAYETGRGSITIRSKAEIVEMPNGKTKIIVTEIPYATNKSELVKKIAELVKTKTIEGITDLRDESNRNGISIVIELKKEANANVILNQLYKHSPLQQNFGIINLMLLDGEPKVFGLKDILREYLKYQEEIIIRRTKFDLEKAQARAHILEGLKIAVNNIDEIVALIKKANNDQEAIEAMDERFGLDEIQAKAILEMKLRRIVGLERDKIEQELDALLVLIKELESILQDRQKVLNIIKEEMAEIATKYGSERRTHIDMTAIDYIDDESLIPEENITITLSKNGYIKRVSNDTYKTQNRGGVGIRAMTNNTDDITDSIISLSTHEDLLLFSNLGKVYRVRGYEIPEFSRQSKGLPIINILPLEKEENITTMINVDQEQDNRYVVFITKNGTVKKTKAEEFKNIRSNGKIAIGLRDDDKLITVLIAEGHENLFIASSSGKVINFKLESLRTSGRTAFGVRGMNIEEDERIVGAELVVTDDEILLVSENGYGKKSSINEFRQTNRGGKGVKGINKTDKTGDLVAIRKVNTENDVLIITDSGIIIRLDTNQISTLSRNAQGVRLIRLKDNQKVSDISLINEVDEIEPKEESDNGREINVNVLDENIDDEIEDQDFDDDQDNLTDDI